MLVHPSPLVSSLWGSAAGLTIRRFRGQLVAYPRISNVPPSAPPPPLPFDCAHRKPGTIAHAQLAATLDNFPLRLHLDADADLSGCRADGHDVRFAAADGLTPLDFDRDNWSGGAGAPVTADFWIRFPEISHLADTPFYLYYQNPALSDAQDPPAVFSNAFTLVHHLHEAAGDAHDATGHGHDGSYQGGLPDPQPAIVGDGQAFSGAGTYVEVPSHAHFDVQPLTWEVWLKTSTNGVFQSIFSRSDAVGDRSGVTSWIDATADQGRAYILPAAGGGTALNSGRDLGDAAWHHLAVVAGVGDPLFTDSIIYVDGLPRHDDWTRTWAFNGQVLRWGMLTNAWWAAKQFVGLLDESRFADVARSPAWIAYTFTNITDNAATVSLGDEEY